MQSFVEIRPNDEFILLSSFKIQRGLNHMDEFTEVPHRRLDSREHSKLSILKMKGFVKENLS